ncbi:MAG: radical SAM protein [Actinobacteria bacterium]|nr:radical SAM protein [Actinomycetota bacterium]MBI3686016.1 radical SAM protein [Actinomycetota bacterium]
MTGGGPSGGLTVLWALRSPCDLACRYCYFGTMDEHRLAPPDQPGALSHLAPDDLDVDDILAFVATLPDSGVERVFLAGGEPLIWPHTLAVAAAITALGVRVVLCTNGIPLNRPSVVAGILAAGVDAVSVSVDSADAAHHDTYRPARGGHHGHHDVLSGVRALLAARDATRRGSTHAAPAAVAGADADLTQRRIPRVGLYTVVTTRNLDAITRVADLAAALGCDYAVPQPISLPSGHPLHAELSLSAADVPVVGNGLTRLRQTPGVRSPSGSYPERFLTAIAAVEPLPERGCFGGRTLFFVEPDGSVWDCPSSLRIAATAPERHRSIRGHSAAEVFHARPGCGDCDLFSRECVNMWPLTGFDTLTRPAAEAHATGRRGNFGDRR